MINFNIIWIWKVHLISILIHQQRMKAKNIFVDKNDDIKNTTCRAPCVVRLSIICLKSGESVSLCPIKVIFSYNYIIYYDIYVLLYYIIEIKINTVYTAWYKEKNYSTFIFHMEYFCFRNTNMKTWTMNYFVIMNK